MEQMISAHFDGKAIIPDEPVQLPVGQRLHVRVELAGAEPARFADLCRFATELKDAPSDLAAQHDHYLYGCPKR
jgi:hypothetical protein